MGILNQPAEEKKTPQTAKRKSVGMDFSSLKPLTSTGTKGFAGYREPGGSSSKFPKGKSKDRDEDAMDSDADDDDSNIKQEEMDDDEVKETGKGMLSPEDALTHGEIAEGVRKMKVSNVGPRRGEQQILISTQLKRQHSAEPLNGNKSPAHKASGRNSPTTSTPTTTEVESTSALSIPGAAEKSSASADVPPEAIVGSPFKKQRASIPGFDDGTKRSLSEASQALNAIANSPNPPSGSAPPTTTNDWAPGLPAIKREAEEDEEL